ncbi:phosphate signaling complex protein PhoU [Thiolapillus brandeum]|uniref:Phosphate-specific transport system accessory protein PhoU n=1 Tax=Thiolapillus brandeum TaxID=1076588 RepID=A0A7U6GKL8_9GAMM|nr:phosphate signaling complex protein PhoU [Thiolapillus brandeum]BAO45416.1 phosphate transport system protein [Thiolapillus brandeum]
MKHDSQLNQDHILRRFDDDMRKLQKRVTKMGRLVQGQITALYEVLAQNDEERAGQIIEGDRSIDLLEVKVDKFIVRLLARRSPVGGDLRFIVTASRIVTDLERLGDETAQMAKVLESEYDNLGICNDRSALEEVREMIHLLLQLLQRVMDAFRHQDYRFARDLAEGKIGISKELEQRLQALMACVTQEGEDVSHAVNLVLILRSLERGLRYTQNIGEHVIYFVCGKDVRHKH